MSTQKELTLATFVCPSKLSSQLDYHSLMQGANTNSIHHEITKVIPEELFFHTFTGITGELTKKRQSQYVKSQIPQSCIRQHLLVKQNDNSS